MMLGSRDAESHISRSVGWMLLAEIIILPIAIYVSLFSCVH